MLEEIEIIKNTPHLSKYRRKKEDVTNTQRFLNNYT